MSGDRRHILLLQGPLGSFFGHLADEIGRNGWRSTRICFNGGDQHYARGDAIVPYQGKPEDWSAWLSDFLDRDPVDAIVLYGDSRFYHQIARELATSRNIAVLCLEEGYIRPGFVTAEWGGNNANSPLMARKAELVEPVDVSELPEPAALGPVFKTQAFSTLTYYFWKVMRRGQYPWLRHHRPGNWLYEISSWTWAGPRKFFAHGKDRKVQARLEKEHAGRYFVVPLQVAVDTQITHHSPFDSVAESIDYIIRSFVDYAPEDYKIILKHHPMDRGHHHYGHQIAILSKELGVEERTVYGFQFDLDRLLAASAGCVTVNSTVGITAMKLGVPTIALGTALYDVPGMTNENDLSDFWKNCVTPMQQKVINWHENVRRNAMLPGSFYREHNCATSAICNKLEARWSK